MYEDLIQRCRDLAKGSKHITQNLIALEVFELFGVNRVEGARQLHHNGNPVKWFTQKLVVNCEPFVTNAKHKDEEAIAKMAELVGTVHPWNCLVLSYGKGKQKLCASDEEVHATITGYFRDHFGTKAEASS